MPGNLAEHLCMNDAFSTVLIMDDSNAASEIQRVICEALNSQDTLDYLLGSLNATEIVRLVSVSSTHSNLLGLCLFCIVILG